MFRELTTRLPANPAMHLWQVLRMLHLFHSSPEDERGLLFVPAAVTELEETILLSSYDQRLRDPLAVIVSCLGSAAASADQLGWACICAAEWAVLNCFPRVVIAFAYAAAYATGSSRYFLVAELAAVSVQLGELPTDDPEGDRTALEERRRQLTELIATEGVTPILCDRAS